MVNSEALWKMSQIEITEVDPATLMNINAVKIEPNLSHEEKTLSYIAQMGNPYCFKSGDIPVRIRFVGENTTLSQSLTRYFARLKQK